MITIEPILQHIAPFSVVLTRLAGLFMFSPVLSSAQIPRQVKALLVLGMALVVYPTLDPGIFAGVGRLQLLSLAPMLATELLIGVVVGIIALTPLWAVQLAGVLMGQQMGLSLAQVYNPAADIEGDSIGQVLFLLALAIFLSLGGIEAMFDSVVHSFAAIPPGGFRPTAGVANLIATLCDSGLQLAMRVSMPVMAIVMVESVSVGFVSKSLPSLNIMSFGFPVRILLGISVLVCGLAGVKQAMNVDIERACAAIGDFGATGEVEANTTAATLEPREVPGG